MRKRYTQTQRERESKKKRHRQKKDSNEIDEMVRQTAIYNKHFERSDS